MKFEKREITLNEYDSVLDMLLAQERLAQVYLQGARAVERKEVRELLKKRLTECLDDVFFLEDLLADIRSEQA